MSVYYAGDRILFLGPEDPLEKEVVIHSSAIAWSYKELTYNAGDEAGAMGSVPGSGRSPGEGNGSSLQCCCLGNPMDRGACWATVHGVAKESYLT